MIVQTRDRQVVVPTTSMEIDWRSGTKALIDTPITINGNTRGDYTHYIFDGGDASDAGWADVDATTTLELQAGSALAYQQDLPLDVGKGVQFGSSSAFFQGNTSGAFGDIDGEDILVEGVIFGPPDFGTTDVFFVKRAAAGGDGYHFQTVSGTGVVRFFLKDTTTLTINGPAADPLSFFHFIAAVNRNEASSNGANCYVNAVGGAGADPSAQTSITNSGELEIGASTSISVSARGRVYYLQIIFLADMHQAGAAGPAEWLALAQDRVALMNGMLSPKSRGDGSPESF